MSRRRDKINVSKLNKPHKSFLLWISTSSERSFFSALLPPAGCISHRDAIRIILNVKKKKYRRRADTAREHSVSTTPPPPAAPPPSRPWSAELLHTHTHPERRLHTHLFSVPTCMWLMRTTPLSSPCLLAACPVVGGDGWRPRSGGSFGWPHPHRT